MSYKTIDRAITAAEESRDPAIRATAELLRQGGGSEHEGALAQAAATARALLTQLGVGQDGEVWPGQQAVSTQHGHVEVVAVEMDGSYRVRSLAWGSYPNDPTWLVPADDVKPIT